MKSEGYPAAINALALSSSIAFHSIKSSISGWSKSKITIFAALLVVPPDLIAPAALSPILRKDITPEETPPPESCSPSPLKFEKFVPVPEPNLNRRASLTQRSIIPPSLTRSSSIDCIKQACGCGREYESSPGVNLPVFGSTYQKPCCGPVKSYL